MICYLQAGELGKPVIQFSPSLKAQDPGALMSKEKRWTSQLKEREFTLLPFFVLCGSSID